jgi:iron(III) transport system substrate-binding protein
MKHPSLFRLAVLGFIGLLTPLVICGCGNQQDAPAAGDEEVVVYTALDEMYSRPVLDAFEEETGIEVRAVYDTEAAKTTGLTNRIEMEANNPRADVFWNNEVAQTIVLKEKGLLEPYESPAAEAVPAGFKDEEHYWTGLAARGRVIIYNTDMVDEPPRSIRDFLKEEWRGRTAIANPLFGTTRTHAAALFAAWGAEEAKSFFRGLLANDVAVLAGNATVRDLVARGEYAAGLTDTDDANGAVEDGLPADWLFPDQDNGLGTLVIPNTVALIKDAPHPEAARKLIDYLLSTEVEEKLARMRSIQIPLKADASAPENVPELADIQSMDVAFDAMAAHMDAAAEFIEDEFVR